MTSRKTSAFSLARGSFSLFASAILGLMKDEHQKPWEKDE